MPLPLLALAAAAPSVIKGISGLFQIGKGNRLAKNNPRPIYNIPEEYQKNVAIAEQMGQVGLPQAQYNNSLNNINRNTAGALTGLSRSANSSAGLASLLRASNDASMNLDAQDASARLQNQRFAFGQRGALAQQKLAKQQWDSIGKYQEQAAAAQGLQGAGRQNAFGALSDLSQLGQSALGAEMFSGMGGTTAPTTGDSTFGQSTSQGMFGTRLSNGNYTFGDNYHYPRMINAPFVKPFFPKTYR